MIEDGLELLTTVYTVAIIMVITLIIIAAI